MRADLVAPSLYSGWLIHFSQMVIRQAVGLELATKLFKSSPPESFQGDPFLEHALIFLFNGWKTGALIGPVISTPSPASP